MKNLVICSSVISAMVLSICIIGCKGSGSHLESAIKFTKADSLTEKYLDLEDSILIAWNTIINDDNLKIQMMHNLVHQLLVSNQLDKERLISVENRLNQLSESKITQETIKDPLLIEEYDSASHMLVAELITLSQSHEAFTYNRVLQQIVATIKEMDQRVDENRNSYDLVADEFNKFIERNEKYFIETDEKLAVEKKGLFQITSRE